MKTTFKIIIFGLFLNLAAGFMSVAITDYNGNPVFSKTDMARTPVYDANGTVVMTNSFNQTINPAGIAENKGNMVFRLLDMIGLGFINKIVSFFDHYMFGFINFLDIMFGKYLTSGVYTMLFGAYGLPGILKTMMTIGYILAAFELWTGKSVTD